jgi:hypothetical protein
MGEYYLPCLPYASNLVWEIKYFSNPVVMSALAKYRFADRLSLFSFYDSLEQPFVLTIN